MLIKAYLNFDRSILKKVMTKIVFEKSNCDCKIIISKQIDILSVVYFIFV